MAWDTQGQQMQMPHPTVGMNGMGAPPMAPQQQGWQQPQQQAPQGWQPGTQPIGMPQYNGQVPVNGMMQQQMPMQPQQQQPHPTVPFGQQPPQQQQQQLPQQPMFQQPPRIQSTGAEILDGPGVPMELRGRTMQQAMQIYSTLAEREIQRQRAGGQQPQQQMLQPGQPAQPQLGQQQQPAQQPRFWQAPEQVVGQQVQQAVQQQLAPVNEFIQRQAVAGALQQASQMIPDFAQLQQHIMPIVQGADPKNLADPAFWEGAADLARGRAFRAQQQQPQQQGWQQPQQQQRFVPAYQLPQPTGSFFTEGPTPPMGGMHQQHQFTPIEQSAMSAMGMSPEMWLSYKQGAQRSQRGW